MPHVIIKLATGRSNEQKEALAAEVAKAVMNIAVCEEQAVSVAIEDVPPADWTEKVYKPLILTAWDKLFKKPGYNPL